MRHCLSHVFSYSRKLSKRTSGKFLKTLALKCNMQNIAVVGCGAIGLTTALAIQNTLGNRNVTIFAKEFSPNTTSDISAGFWEPYLLGNTPHDKVYRWAKITYEYLLKLWREGQAAEAGISLIPATYLTDKANFIRPNWLDITLGYTELPKKILLKYGELLGKQFTAGFTFTSFTWEAVIFLPYLQKKFMNAGGKIVNRYITSFEELEGYDLIVNCSGLGAQKLADDHLMEPIRGQVIKINAPWINHIVLSDTDESCYIIPNTYTVTLGGTKQRSYNLNTDEVDENNILRNCSQLVPAIKSAKIIKHLVGLRPGRDRVRLEAEIKGNEKNGLRIVHNYGHGGAGITLSVGCAEEAAELVGNVLRSQVKHKL